MKFANKSQVIDKLDRQREISPMSMAKNQFYLTHHKKSAIPKNEENLDFKTFSGVPVTPLKLIGTQRTPYTHRKNRMKKKIGEQM